MKGEGRNMSVNDTGNLIVYLHIQEVCYQYWSSSGSQRYGEFTVELLWVERLQGFVLRTMSVQDAKVSPRGWLETQPVTGDLSYHAVW